MKSKLGEPLRDLIRRRIKVGRESGWPIPIMVNTFLEEIHYSAMNSLEISVLPFYFGVLNSGIHYEISSSMHIKNTIETALCYRNSPMVEVIFR